MEEIIIKEVRTKEISKKGQEWFERYNDDLKDRYEGKAIVIEVDSGDYFIGNDSIEATKKAKEKDPDKIFFLGRIGYPTYYSFISRRVIC